MNWLTILGVTYLFIAVMTYAHIEGNKYQCERLNSNLVEIKK